MSLYFLIYIILIAAGFTASIIHRRQLSMADTCISILLLITFISEILNHFSFMFFHNNGMFIFHIFTPVEFLLISIYYNSSIPGLRRNNIGVIIGLAGLAVAVSNALFFQDTTQLNSVMLLFEGFFTIALSLFALYNILLQDDVNLKKSAHFWFSVFLLIYFAFTFTRWGVFYLYGMHSNSGALLLGYLHWGINVLFYGSFFIVFLNYRKLIPSGE